MKANYVVKCSLFRDRGRNVGKVDKKFTWGNFLKGKV